MIVYSQMEARTAAEKLMNVIGDTCARIEVAGSLRRGKTQVHDVEVVVQPYPHRHLDLLARLDKMVILKQASKAVYGSGEQRYRWGNKYRGLLIDNVRVEVFLADKHNWGYILWLRTGPGDANQYVMQQMLGAPYRARDGYWWKEGRKLSVFDEAEMFRLLTGRDRVIPPAYRSIERYRQVLLRDRWVEVHYAEDAPAPLQGLLL